MQVGAPKAVPLELEALCGRPEVPEADSSRIDRLEAHVGRLIAEATSLEGDNAWLQLQLKEAQADKWYLEIAKTGLEDRVAHLAAALVQV